MQVLAASSGGGSPLTLLFPLLLIALFYFLLIRPQRQRARQAQDVQGMADVGAEVMTTSGMYGTVVDIDGNTLVIEAAPGIRLRFDRRAVSRVLTPAPTAPDTLPDEVEPEVGPNAEDRPPTP